MYFGQNKNEAPARPRFAQIAAAAATEPGELHNALADHRCRAIFLIWSLLICPRALLIRQQ